MLKIYLILIFLLSIIFLSFIKDKNSTSYQKFVRYDAEVDDFNLPVIEEETEIPKIIHRNYGLKDGKADLKKYDSVFESTKRIDPDMKEELIFGKDEMEKFILKYYNNEVLDTIKLINFNYSACISDILRLLVIYAKGGVYMDIKSQIVSKISDDLDYYKGKLLVSYFSSIPFVFTGWTTLPPYGEISNWFFAAPKGHPVLRECIIQGLTNIKKAYQEKEKFQSGRPYILSLTGPHMITYVIKESKNYNKVKFLPSMSLTNFNFAGWNGKLRKEGYGINNTKHQKGTHWGQLKEPLFN
mgnify:CR=1 FL=1|tara:strand:+ start:734 stop:1627 length:894 start_codon:yes stop_codon:yes gene_type:complete